MKALLLRFWQWLGRLLGQDAGRAAGAEALPAIGTVAPPPSARDLPPPPPSVALPPGAPPQLDLHTGEGAQFGRKASILTKPEQRTYHALRLAAGNDFQVMAKVRLWDIFWLTNEPPERKQHLSRLSCRHVDFLLCEPETLKPRLGIELDDSSHQKPEAVAADRYKDELFFAARLPLLRLAHPNLPPQRLRATIRQVLEEWQ